MAIPPNLHLPDATPSAVRAAFEKAWQGFTPLHGNAVYLKARLRGEITMRAQPILNASFFSRKRRAFKIEYQPFPVFLQKTAIEELPPEVLVGWFAHEFGHLMDYLRRPWYDLLKLGLAYATLPVYRTGMERRADLFAIEQGFAASIQMTKRFILSASDIPDKYLDRITRHYMSPEEVEAIVLQRQTLSAARDSVI